MSRQEEDKFYEFLCFLLIREFGVSEKMAKRFASQFDSLGELLRCRGKVKELKKANGRKLIPLNATVEKIEKALERIDPSLSIQQNYISSIGRVFSARQLENIRKLSLDDINPNPFLLKALHLKSIEELIELLGFARITRSIVTSFGFFFEDILVASGATKVKKEGFDIVKLREGIQYFIQCKSGTNDMDKDQIVYWIEKIRKLEEKNENVRGIIGMPYGKRESSTVSLGLLKQYFSDELESHVFIGKELWEFISDKPEFHKEVLYLLEKAAEATLKENSIVDEIKNKIKELAEEFHAKYGYGQEAITNFLHSSF